MRCPFCGAADTKVIDSRPYEENTAIRRRRQCEICGKRFTTYEKLEMFPLMVIKKDQNREAYDREKIRNGIVLACHKRPIGAGEMDRLVDEVENALFSSGDREVTSAEIGEMVMEKLKKLDKVAYVRFASVYRSFTDVETFVEALERLQQEK